MTTPRRLFAPLLAILACALAGSAAEAATVKYYHLDAVGNVLAVTRADGAVLETHDYLPYGEEWCAGAICGSNLTPGQPLRFTGKERDTETGLDYFGARYYGSRIGRFTTVDPYLDPQATLVNPQKWNRYSYALNNPLRFVDPDGRVERTTYEARMLAEQRAASGYQHPPSGPFETALMTTFAVVTLAPVVGLAIEAAPLLSVAGGGGLAARAQQIHQAVGRVTQEKTTIAVARAVSPDGRAQVFVASSEKALRPAQRALLQAGETAAQGSGHAEVTAINAARAAGTKVTDVAASRGICGECARTIEAVGARARSPLKDPQ